MTTGLAGEEPPMPDTPSPAEVMDVGELLGRMRRAANLVTPLYVRIELLHQGADAIAAALAELTELRQKLHCLQAGVRAGAHLASWHSVLDALAELDGRERPDGGWQVPDCTAELIELRRDRERLKALLEFQVCTAHHVHTNDCFRREAIDAALSSPAAAADKGDV